MFAQLSNVHRISIMRDYGRSNQTFDSRVRANNLWNPSRRKGDKEMNIIGFGKRWTLNLIRSLYSWLVRVESKWSVWFFFKISFGWLTIAATYLIVVCFVKLSCGKASLSVGLDWCQSFRIVVDCLGIREGIWMSVQLSLWIVSSF